MKVALLTREYPPEVYGGAGVHVEYLARELAHLVDVDVHCFGGDRHAEGAAPRVFSYRSWDRLAGPAPYLAVLRAMAVDLAMAAGAEGADVVHSHTWYANFAGHVAKLIYRVPHVCTVHSLEPMRPWKAEQLGGGYRLSTFCEQTALEHADALIAVSSAVRDDVVRCYPAVDPARVHVVHNGIDPTDFHPDDDVEALKRHGVDPTAPTVILIGRVTRQKGIQYFLQAAAHLDPSVQVVLCAGSPDTPELGQELARQVDGLRGRRRNVVWIEVMLERWEVRQLLTHADVCCCPSIYEPLGLVNLEAMACGTAVVASAVGGIPEVFRTADTGLLVPFAPVAEHDPAPADPQVFVTDLAAALNTLLNDPALRKSMGRAGRQRVVEQFSWAATARRTLEVYRTLLPKGRHVNRRS